MVSVIGLIDEASRKAHRHPEVTARLHRLSPSGDSLDVLTTFVHFYFFFFSFSSFLDFFLHHNALHRRWRGDMVGHIFRGPISAKARGRQAGKQGINAFELEFDPFVFTAPQGTHFTGFEAQKEPSPRGITRGRSGRFARLRRNFEQYRKDSSWIAVTQDGQFSIDDP